MINNKIPFWRHWRYKYHRWPSTSAKLFHIAFPLGWLHICIRVKELGGVFTRFEAGVWPRGWSLPYREGPFHFNVSLHKFIGPIVNSWDQSERWHLRVFTLK